MPGPSGKRRYSPPISLHNTLVVIVDNGYQALSRTQEVMNLGSLTRKFAAFSETAEVDGHDEAALSDRLQLLLRRGRLRACLGSQRREGQE